ncbi:hypothetical protein EV421DRAFT_116652 [Armillaria borealis]|uniref:Uncharacterized protein n=1 Tax=Armillaria borealis TaxID=47425 RepID=A0AA39JVG5_9AGAR|nr:hypothetical protein EV421DRAFT_116652 [Armillaria borealis]
MRLPFLVNGGFRCWRLFRACVWCPFTSFVLWVFKFVVLGCSFPSFQFIVRLLFPCLPCFTKPFLPCPVLVSCVCASQGIGRDIRAHENKRDGKASTIHGHGIKTPEQEHNRNTNTGTTMHGNTTGPCVMSHSCVWSCLVPCLRVTFESLTSSSHFQNSFYRTNNNMFILRTVIDLALTCPERTENLSMLHSLISLTPSHPLINPLSGLRLWTHR